MIECPLVSVVIPVRNDARRLQVCLESIKANDYPADRIELIVVDNGSTDNSVRVARQAGATVLSIAGVSVAELRNRGAACARGEILAFVDADHAINTNWIAAAVAILSTDDVAAAGAPYLPPSGANWVQCRYNLLREHRESTSEVEWLGGGNLAMSRAVFDRAGGFDPSLEACEDVDLCMRIRACGGRILNAPALRCAHFGDPSTLWALFVGELWRGRNNLRVTFRGRRSPRTLASATIPLLGLLGLLSATVLVALGWGQAAMLSASVLPLLAALRAATMVARDRPRTPIRTVQSFLVALVYDAARALAILARTSHHVRRTGNPISHVTADSHS
jgi:GT2 family glycosyltransferase